MSDDIQITVKQAQAIVNGHIVKRGEIVHFEEYSQLPHRPGTKSYLIQTQDNAYILKVAQPSDSSSTPSYAPNSLAAEYGLVTSLRKTTSLPLPTPHALDESRSLIGYPYFLFDAPTGRTLASTRAQLTQRQSLQIDLRIGSYLKQLHEVQNDWFGLPRQEHDGIYSWQEAFTSLLEDLLSAAEDQHKTGSLGVTLPMEDVRRYLSRAIGFYLFDDCEVPSFVWFSGSEDNIFVEVADPEAEPKITSLAGFDHALWGDPLLERLFMDPSAAMLEGYGGSLVVFPRQKTKRIWYTLYMALLVLVEGDGREGMKSWARQAFATCLEQLKDAACY